ncbi:hypothetical protein GBF38_005597, partial [Nibea albiflora]
VSDQAAVVEEGGSSDQGPLVAVSFQKNVNRKQKYLEAEPKALGITQIGLSLFQILSVSMFLSKDLGQQETDIPFFISSIIVVIAGAVAVAAQNLELPTLRACLGMQVVACAASIFNFILCLVKMDMHPYCRYHYDENFTLHYGVICHNVEATESHFYAEGSIIQVALIAISTTLAAYCCKVVNCCMPAPKMPVITVQTPAVQQQ